MSSLLACYVLPRAEAGLECLPLLLRALIPCGAPRDSFKPIYLPEAPPPNAITLVTRASPHDFSGLGKTRTFHYNGVFMLPCTLLLHTTPVAFPTVVRSPPRVKPRFLSKQIFSGSFFWALIVFGISVIVLTAMPHQNYYKYIMCVSNQASIQNMFSDCKHIDYETRTKPMLCYQLLEVKSSLSWGPPVGIG